MKLVKLVTDPIQKLYAGLARDEEARLREYRVPPRRFRASEASDCRRKIYYRLGGFVPEPSPPWLNLVADSGNFHHDYSRHVANYYGVGFTGITEEADGKVVEEETTVRTFEYAGKTFDVSCRADAGLPIEIEGQEGAPGSGPERATVEIKSMSPKNYDEMQRAFESSGGIEKAFEILVEKHIDYVWQGITTALAKALRYVYFLPIGRGNNEIAFARERFGKPHTWDPTGGDHRGIVFEVTEDDKNNVLQKFADITTALEEGKPPAPDYTDGSTACNRCAFWYLCHGKKKRAKYPIAGVLE